MGRNWQEFTKEFVGKDDESVREKVLSVIGSKHGTKRTNIKIDSVDEIEAEDIQDLVIRDLMEEK